MVRRAGCRVEMAGPSAAASASRTRPPARRATRRSHAGIVARIQRPRAVSTCTRSRVFSTGTRRGSMPDGARNAGIAPPDPSHPELAVQARREHAGRRDDRTIASTTSAAASPSVYGPGGHSRASRPPRAQLRPASAPLQRVAPDRGLDSRAHDARGARPSTLRLTSVASTPPPSPPWRARRRPALQVPTRSGGGARSPPRAASARISDPWPIRRRPAGQPRCRVQPVHQRPRPSSPPPLRSGRPARSATTHTLQPATRVIVGALESRVEAADRRPPAGCPAPFPPPPGRRVDQQHARHAAARRQRVRDGPPSSPAPRMATVLIGCSVKYCNEPAEALFCQCPSLSGKVAVVTGGSRGIGLAPRGCCDRRERQSR